MLLSLLRPAGLPLRPTRARLRAWSSLECRLLLRACCGFGLGPSVYALRDERARIPRGLWRRDARSRPWGPGGPLPAGPHSPPALSGLHARPHARRPAAPYGRGKRCRHPCSGRAGTPRPAALGPGPPSAGARSPPKQARALSPSLRPTHGTCTARALPTGKATAEGRRVPYSSRLGAPGVRQLLLTRAAAPLPYR